MNFLQYSQASQKYLIIEKGKQGSYGIVYKAKNKQSGEIVAIKKFKSFGSEGISTSYIRELNIFSLLKGQRCLKIIEIYEDQYHQQYLVTDWMDLDLEDVIPVLSGNQKKIVFGELVKAILEFHQNNIVHRDLKPTNIMIKEKVTNDQTMFNLKIIDYGMSRELPWGDEKMTNAVGTLYYRAPQLLIGLKRYGKQVDIWSLGCVFYQLLTNKFLFKGANDIAQLKKITEIVGISQQTLNSLFLKQVCLKFSLENCDSKWSKFENILTEVELDLLKKMLKIIPAQRIKGQQILNHAYFNDIVN